MQTSVDDALEDMAHTVSRPFPYVEVRIGDPLSSVPLAPGELGEVYPRIGLHDLPDARNDGRIEEDEEATSSK